MKKDVHVCMCEKLRCVCVCVRASPMVLQQCVSPSGVTV